MKKQLLLILAIMLQASVMKAQSNSSIALIRPASVPDSLLVDEPDEMPEFPGGITKLYSYLGNNLEYPSKAANIGIQGKVIVEFVVCEDGSLCNEKIINSFDSDCSKEVLRVVSKMPAWKPGTKDGKTIKAKYRLPVVFNLAE